METVNIKQKPITVVDYRKEYGIDVGSRHSNNYASCYAIPISTPEPKPKPKVINYTKRD